MDDTAADDLQTALTATGLRWRPLTPDDAPAVHALVAIIEGADRSPGRSSLVEVREWLATPAPALADGSLLGLDVDGDPVAYAVVSTRPGDTGVQRAFLHVGVRPDHRGRGVGRALVAWAADAARIAAGDVGEGAPAQAVLDVDDSAPESTHRLLRDAGFTVRRKYAYLRRDLGTPPPEPRLRPGLRVVPWSEDLEEPIRLAHNDAFRDHPGSEPQDDSTWRWYGRSTFEPGWSFAVVTEPDSATHAAALAAGGDDTLDDETRGAVDGGAPLVAGYHIGQRHGGDAAYTMRLGVRRAFRGHGVAVALLDAAMRAYLADGVRWAELDVDTENPSGADGLYAHLGYRPQREIWTYVRDL
ncbi:GNAT family N-acetyltransferase [Luteimicrobium subarcticum]|uniref:Acetyltransferase (GNAT) family protein n=1 Tax=Luteimicrobium subarcticum TaxID=620910 RepID=A0A2M8W474_9MICO|nr:GNAT family N-acetyltransferase [Luteimicrobium subarcticum]PJI85726.1 acetyltransferase (GNAT) family protein [Luteimicrobium subarcticum]